MSLLNTEDINNTYLLQKLETNFPYMSELIEGIKYNEFGKQTQILKEYQTLFVGWLTTYYIEFMIDSTSNLIKTPKYNRLLKLYNNDTDKLNAMIRKHKRPIWNTLMEFEKFAKNLNVTNSLKIKSMKSDEINAFKEKINSNIKSIDSITINGVQKSYNDFNDLYKTPPTKEEPKKEEPKKEEPDSFLDKIKKYWNQFVNFIKSITQKIIEYISSKLSNINISNVWEKILNYIKNIDKHRLISIILMGSFISFILGGSIYFYKNNTLEQSQQILQPPVQPSVQPPQQNIQQVTPVIMNQNQN